MSIVSQLYASPTLLIVETDDQKLDRQMIVMRDPQFVFVLLNLLIDIKTTKVHCVN